MKTSNYLKNMRNSIKSLTMDVRPVDGNECIPIVLPVCNYLSVGQISGWPSSTTLSNATMRGFGQAGSAGLKHRPFVSQRRVSC